MERAREKGSGGADGGKEGISCAAPPRHDNWSVCDYCLGSRRAVVALAGENEMRYNRVCDRLEDDDGQAICCAM